MANKIGIVLAVDGEREFTQAFANVNKSLQVSRSEAAKVKAEFEGQQNTIEALTAKHEVLSKKLQEQKEKQKIASDALKSTQEQYSAAEKRLEALRHELEKAKEKQDQMTRSGQSSKKELREQEKTIAQYNTAVGKQESELEKCSNKVKTWQQRLNTADKEVIESNRALNQNAVYMKEAEQATDHCAKSIDNFGKKIQGASKVTLEWGERFKGAIADKAVDIATGGLERLKDAAVDAAKYSIEVGSSFEAAMSEVEAISGAAGSQLDQMSQKAKQLGSTTKFSATEVAQGFKYMSLAGWSTEQMLSGIDGIVNLAAASEMDLAEASDMVTDYLSAFGLEAEDAGKMADQMAFAQANSNTTVKMLGESFANCAADMHAAGQDMETTTSLLEAMANQGTKGAEAGTAVSAMMRDISQKMKNGKIEIGDTAVAVQDSAGNFRDLTDILADVEKATTGMGTAEKRAALQKTFTARSMKAVNEILTEGVDRVSAYEDALRSSEGAAAEMAETMQDNLKGSITEFKSATEGLGIAVYDKVKGPLKGAVDLATSAVSGLTKAISPKDLDPMEAYIEKLKEINDAAESAANSASETISNAAMDTGTIQTLGARLMELNGVEELTVTQRGEMRAIVDELKESVPELAAAYDAETGSLKLTNEQLAEYIKNSKTDLISQAASNAKSALYSSMFDMQMEMSRAEEVVQSFEDEGNAMGRVYTDLKAKIEDFADAQKILEESQDYYSEEAQQAILTQNSIIEAFQAEGLEVDGTVAGLNLALTEYTKRMDEQENQMGEALTELERLRTGYSSLNGQLEEIDETAQKMIETSNTEVEAAEKNAASIVKSEKEKKEARITTAKAAAESGNEILLSQKAWEELEEAETDAERKAVDSSVEMKSALLGVGTAGAAAGSIIESLPERLVKGTEEAVDEIEDGVDSLTEKIKWSAKQQTEAVKKAAEDSKAAYQQAWESLKEAAKNTISFSISSEFDGGDDLTTEKMNANLQSQIDGYKQYYEELQRMRELVAEGIISPEFFSNIEQQGTAAANEIHHMIWTIDNQGEYGEEQVRGISDKWTEALKWEDVLSSVIAGDQAALEEAFKSLGSSDVEFDTLRNAVSSGLEGTDEEMQARIQSLVDTAQKVGATIPEGLAESINSTDISPEDIEEQLNAAIDGAMDGLLEVAQLSGAEVPEELADSIAAGSADVEDAYDQLISGISDKVTSADGIKEAGQEAVVEPIAESIEDGKGEVKDAASDMVDGAVEEVGNKASEFSKAGEDSTSKYAEGMRSQQPQAVSAGQELSAAALNAASAGSASWYDVGVNMGRGLSEGIRSQAVEIARQAAETVRQALDAAKSAGEIHSPSRKFRDEVGKMMGKGQALGIALSTKDNEKAAQTMVEKTIQAAAKAAQKARTASDLNYLWDTVTSKAISANFGVAQKTKTKSGKKTKTTTKTDDSYYSEIYSAAQSYFDQLSLKQKQSTKSELAYWQAVQKRLKNGTKAYAQAAQQIESIKEEIGSYSVASDLLSEWETYYDVSALAEEQYWDRVRRNYAKGTEDRAKADEKYLEAKKKRNEKLKDLEEDLAKKTQDATDRYNEALQSRIDTLKSAFDLFEAFESESESGEQLLFNMQSQAEGYQYWREQITALQKRGILSDDLINELTERGPSDTAAIVALNTLDDKQLRQYNEAYLKKMDQVQQQAKKDTIADAKERDAAIKEATKEYKDSIAELNVSLDTRLKEIASTIKSIAGDEVDKKVQEAAYGSSGGSSEAKSSAPGVTGALAPAAATKTAAVSVKTETKSEKDKILEIINTGKSRSKKMTSAEKKAHVALWEYIVSKYGRTPSYTMYGQLADALGITLKKHSKATSAEKTKILNALKKKGLQSGTVRLDDDFAWMDELGIGSELIVRKSDNARLNTNVQRGDMIVPAANTENLWEWSKVMPDDFERQMAAIQSEVTRVMGSVASMTAMNAKALQVFQGAAATTSFSAGGQDTTQMVVLLRRMVDLLQNGQEIYLDSGELVGSTAGKMSAEFAARRRRRR